MVADLPEPTAAVTDAASGPSRIGQMLAAAAMVSACAASGYYLSRLQGGDPLVYAGIGAGIGVVLGWMVIRWTSRSHDVSGADDDRADLSEM